MQPLTDDEAALLYTVQMQGSAAYPIDKLGRHWVIRSWRSWTGFPTVFKTKKAAVERFELWTQLARERWADMRRDHPEAILTAVGIRGV